MELNKILAEQDVLMHLPNVSGGSFQECHIGGAGLPHSTFQGGVSVRCIMIQGLKQRL